MSDRGSPTANHMDHVHVTRRHVDRRASVFRLGLTGGIGSGKSTVSARLATHGAIVIDYDLLAREAVEPGTPALAAIAERFGADVIAADGTLDRTGPRQRWCSATMPHGTTWRPSRTPPSSTSPSQREATVPDDAVVVHDHPLLVEMGMAAFCDLVVVVDVPEDVQVERLVTLRGMTEADARARMAAQASREERLAAADIVLDNTGSIEDLEARVDEIWAEQVNPRLDKRTRPARGRAGRVRIRWLVTQPGRDRRCGAAS